MKNQRSTKIQGKRQKNNIRKTLIQAINRKANYWKKLRKVKPQDIAALVATLASTTAAVYSAITDLTQTLKSKPKPKPRKKKTNESNPDSQH